ncbi:hypothetical protein EDD11_007389 [Mortierella claussenii]|nr:hypothetical protein EDD11_007389 [Mortierella claussenii]
MSTFSPPPTDGLDHCRNGCPDGQACFLYSGGTTCQPYQIPESYPVTGSNTSVVSPPGWYLVSSYPSVRYTGSLTNQTQNANCTTIPIPIPLFRNLVRFIGQWDMGDFFSSLDSQYQSTLVQFRGNCAEGFYCQPSVSTSTEPITDARQPVSLQGELPGTCQSLRAENEACQASAMCIGWHIQPDWSYDNDQFRCSFSSVGQPSGGGGGGRGGNNTTSLIPLGVCKNIGVGKGKLDIGQPVQQSARTYLLSTMFLFLLIILYLWYRRQRARQRQHERAMDDLSVSGGGVGSALFHDNMENYTRRGGVYRPPDGTDNGELPAYGQHRRDERLVGPAAEEIGMYSFASPGPPPLTPNSPYGPPPTTPPPLGTGAEALGATSRPVQHSYPFPMSHPQLNTVLNHPGGPPAAGGALYPPPTDSPPLTAQQAEAAAVAAAAIQIPATCATTLRDGGLLPPAYEPPLSPSLQQRNNIASGTEGATTVAGLDPLHASGAMTNTNTAGVIVTEPPLTRGQAEAGGEKQDPDYQNHVDQTLVGGASSSKGNSPRPSYTKEKTSMHEYDHEQDGADPDHASTSSGAGSGTASGSGAPSRAGSTMKK